MKKLLFAVVVLCMWSAVVAAQNVEVTKNNKTIAVTADQSVSVDPELAIVTLGYLNFAATNKEAYDENVRYANLIVMAMLKAGLDKRFIESGTVTLAIVEQGEKWTEEERKQKKYSAGQSWTVRVPSWQAQKLVDVAMRAGANNLENVTWEVVDRGALQAKAGAAALAKARKIAEQMAQGLNAKLGALVYASNRAPAVRLFDMPGRLATETAVMSTVEVSAEKMASIELFPVE